MYDKSGNCSTYCDIETDLGGTLGTVYMVIRGTTTTTTTTTIIIIIIIIIII